MTELSVYLDHHTDHSVLTITGELDAVSAPRLSAGIDTAFEEGRRHLTVDAAGLAFCDSCGLRTLLVAHRRYTGMGGSLRLVNVHGTVLRLLRLTGVDQIFAVPVTGRTATSTPPDAVVV